MKLFLYFITYFSITLSCYAADVEVLIKPSNEHLALSPSPYAVLNDYDGSPNLGIINYISSKKRRQIYADNVKIISIKGWIDYETVEETKALIQKLKNKFSKKMLFVATLDSEVGGIFNAGIALSKLFEEFAIMTYVADTMTCRSACALAFMGGSIRQENGNIEVARLLAPGAVLGFHAPFIEATENSPSPRKMTFKERIRDYQNGIKKIGELIVASDSNVNRWPTNLLGNMLSKGPDDFFEIDTIGEAYLYNIGINDNAFPIELDPSDLNKQDLVSSCIFSYRISSSQKGGALSKYKKESEFVSELVALFIPMLYEEAKKNSVVDAFQASSADGNITCTFVLRKSSVDEKLFMYVSTQYTSVDIVADIFKHDGAIDFFDPLNPISIIPFDTKLTDLLDLLKLCEGEFGGLKVRGELITDKCLIDYAKNARK